MSFVIPTAFIAPFSSAQPGSFQLLGFVWWFAQVTTIPWTKWMNTIEQRLLLCKFPLAFNCSPLKPRCIAISLLHITKWPITSEITDALKETIIIRKCFPMKKLKYIVKRAMFIYHGEKCPIINMECVLYVITGERWPVVSFEKPLKCLLSFSCASKYLWCLSRA